MKSCNVVIRNAHGIHCRPSAVIIKEAERHGCDIELIRGDGRCDCRSMMGLLSMNLHEGAEAELRCSGPEEEKVLAIMSELFETHFDFPPRE